MARSDAQARCVLKFLAPFAFLGSEHDETLRRFYVGVTTRDIFKQCSVLAHFLIDALADDAPLRRLLTNLVDQNLLNLIAAEYLGGRLLLIGTTNLDAQRASGLERCSRGL